MKMSLWSAAALVAVMTVLVAGDANAGRKPKEIVVVGSKVKEVIRSAGLLADEGLIDELNRDIHRLLQGAAKRARANGRKTVRPYDLSSLPCSTNPDLIVRSSGLRSDGDLVQAVSDKVHEILEDAIHRCTSNGRSTVRPYDL